MRKAGIEYKDAPFYIPPYEYYNKEISAWAKSMGIQVVNFTPGTGTNADYTTPDMKNYRSSKAIYDRVMEVEKKEGLNGHLMLIHFGTHDDRTDKFYKGYMVHRWSHVRSGKRYGSEMAGRSVCTVHSNCMFRYR